MTIMEAKVPPIDDEPLRSQYLSNLIETTLRLKNYEIPRLTEYTLK